MLYEVITRRRRERGDRGAGGAPPDSRGAEIPGRDQPPDRRAPRLRRRRGGGGGHRARPRSRRARVV